MCTKWYFQLSPSSPTREVHNTTENIDQARITHNNSNRFIYSCQIQSLQRHQTNTSQIPTWDRSPSPVAKRFEIRGFEESPFCTGSISPRENRQKQRGENISVKVVLRFRSWRAENLTWLVDHYDRCIGYYPTVGWVWTQLAANWEPPRHVWWRTSGGIFILVRVMKVRIAVSERSVNRTLSRDSAACRETSPVVLFQPKIWRMSYGNAFES